MYVLNAVASFNLGLAKPLRILAILVLSLFTLSWRTRKGVKVIIDRTVPGPAARTCRRFSRSLIRRRHRCPGHGAYRRCVARRRNGAHATLA